MIIKCVSDQILMRYETMIKNIKNNSNSFYDSYLDLLESTIKYVLDNNEIEYDQSKTCGLILKTEAVYSFLNTKLCVDKNTYDKFFDYIKKCNDHKHKKEKILNIDSIVNYLKIYFIFLNYYYDFIGESLIDYKESYFYEIFRETELLNKKYREQINELNQELNILYDENKIATEEFKEIEKLLIEKEIENLEFDKQNEILLSHIQVLNMFKNNYTLNNKVDDVIKQNEQIINILETNIKNDSSQEKINKEKNEYLINSKKEYLVYDRKNFDKNKRNVKIYSLIIILLGIVNTIINTIFNNIYTTYSLFENVYLIFTFIILMKNSKLKYSMDDKILHDVSTFKYKYMSINLMQYSEKEKFFYKFMRILTYVASICSIIMVRGFNMLIIAILEISFIALLFIHTKYRKKVNSSYSRIIRFSGKIKENEIISYYDINNGKFTTEPDLKKIYEI